jgi:hypothetical protein
VLHLHAQKGRFAAGEKGIACCKREALQQHSPTLGATSRQLSSRGCWDRAGGWSGAEQRGEDVEDAAGLERTPRREGSTPPLGMTGIRREGPPPPAPPLLRLAPAVSPPRPCPTSHPCRGALPCQALPNRGRIR